jgi:hypothetical protein
VWALRRRGLLMSAASSVAKIVPFFGNHQDQLRDRLDQLLG